MEVLKQSTSSSKLKNNSWVNVLSYTPSLHLSLCRWCQKRPTSLHVIWLNICCGIKTFNWVQQNVFVWKCPECYFTFVLIFFHGEPLSPAGTPHAGPPETPRMKNVWIMLLFSTTQGAGPDRTTWVVKVERPGGVKKEDWKRGEWSGPCGQHSG